MYADTAKQMYYVHVFLSENNYNLAWWYDSNKDQIHAVIWWTNDISQIQKCFIQISHNAPFVAEICTHVHISVTKWCIVGHDTNASCGLHNRSIDVTLWEE